jgi:hypothetical protein
MVDGLALIRGELLASFQQIKAKHNSRANPVLISYPRPL